jgi:competence protein ComEC
MTAQVEQRDDAPSQPSSVANSVSTAPAADRTLVPPARADVAPESTAPSLQPSPGGRGGPAEDAGTSSEASVPHYHPLVIVLAAVAAGIVADRFWPLPLAAWWIVAVGAIAAWLAIWRRGRQIAAYFALLTAIAATSAAWHHCRWYLMGKDDLGLAARRKPEPICIDAIALQTPRRMPELEASPLRPPRSQEQVRLQVDFCAVRDGTTWRPASGRANLEVEGWLANVHAGDRLRIFAQLEEPPQAQNPGQTDPAARLRAEGIRSQLQAKFAESIAPLAAGSAWSPRRMLDMLRTRGDRVLAHYLDRRVAPLAAAVLLGAREELDPERTEAFVETGTIHLLVIAGLHLGILAGTLLWLVRRTRLRRDWAVTAVALFTLGYMLLVEAQPPVVRATVLVVVTCGAMLLGRRGSSYNSLAAAALAVLAWNPNDLFHVGPQLSFLCVAGLMWFGPQWIYSRPETDPLEHLLAENRGPVTRTAYLIGRSLRHLTLVSLGMWLLTLPLVMANFHVLAPISILLNTLVWIPLAIGLVSGFGILVLGGIPLLAHLCAIVCNSSLALLEWLVRTTQHLPGARTWVPGPDTWWLVVFYAALAVAAAFPRLRPPRRWALALLATWISVGFAVHWLRADHRQLHCTFLSVGHGEAIVLELPSGRTMLYDAGAMAAPNTATRAVANYLWSRGLTHLDAVVLSHGDVDHYNGLPGLLERFSVGVIYVSPVMFEESRNAALRYLQDVIRGSRVPLRMLSAGDQLAGGPNCTLTVLHPPKHGVLGSDNANSLTLLVACQGRRLLLTGDLAPPGLDDVLAEEPLHCDVLLVPHHGSRQSAPPRLAAWSTPTWAVISGSLHLKVGETAAAYRHVGSRVVHTGDVGAIMADLSSAGVKVRGFLPAPTSPRGKKDGD